VAGLAGVLLALAPLPEQHSGSLCPSRVIDGMAYLFGELRRRGVHRVGAAYVVAAFALLQGADIVLPALGFPPAAMTLIVVLAIAGLPLAAALAWTFDLTSRGIERTPATSPSTTRGQVTRPGRSRGCGARSSSHPPRSSWSSTPAPTTPSATTGASGPACRRSSARSDAGWSRRARRGTRFLDPCRCPV
jgi:hypothetical protein